MDRLPQRASADADAKHRQARGERRAVPQCLHCGTFEQSLCSLAYSRITRGSTTICKRCATLLPAAKLLPRYFPRNGYWSAQEARISLALPAGCTTSEAYRLTVPSADSKTSVTLAGAPVTDDGNWKLNAAEKLSVT